MTLSAVITPITEKTPMETPSMVSAERSLLVFSAVRAMRTVSFMVFGYRCSVFGDLCSVFGWQSHTDNRQPTTAYSYLSASIGSSRAAVSAGKKPEKMPVTVETIRPRTTSPKENVIGNDGNAAATAVDISQERMTP